MAKTIQNASHKSSAKRIASSARPIDMEPPATRLRQLRIAKGIKTAAEAATRFGWEVVTYRQHENGTRPIPRDQAIRYCEAYGATIDFLYTGKGYINNKPNKLSQFELASQPIPILSWAVIGAAQNQQKMLDIKSKDYSYVPRKSGISGRARSFIVEDDSATDVAKSYPWSFQEGDEVLFDPKAKPTPGKPVVAWHPLITAGAPRIYAERSSPDNGETIIELIPINPAFRTVRMREGDGSYICGVPIRLIRSV